MSVLFSLFHSRFIAPVRGALWRPVRTPRRDLALATLLLATLPGAYAADPHTETLPDAAQWRDDSADMADRFRTPPLDADEMEAMYLETPLNLENVEKRKGSDSITDELRFIESDLFFRSKRQEQNLDQPPPAPIERLPEPVEAPTLTPMRNL